MKAEVIDVWGKCPECGVNWNKKKFSMIGLVKYFHPISYALKCHKCMKEWPVKEWPKTWE
ncbi:MAG: hypothetical protein ACR2PH_05945 [Desulfobulbia bacterium]